MAIGAKVRKLARGPHLFRRIGDESRARDHLAVVREPSALAKPRCLGLAHLRSVVVLEVRFPTEAELLVRLAGRAAHRTVDAPRNDLPAVVLGD